MKDNWLTKEDFLRITDTGPESFVEALWFYLYVEGIRKVPFTWEFARVVHLFGKPFLPLFRLYPPKLLLIVGVLLLFCQGYVPRPLDLILVSLSSLLLTLYIFLWWRIS